MNFKVSLQEKKIGEIERAGGLSKVIVSQRDC